MEKSGYEDERAGVSTNPELIIRALSDWQYLRPHATIDEIVRRLVSEFRCCPAAAAQSLSWLTLEGSHKIGRLRRVELVQLARAVHRFWSQTVEGSASR